MVQELPFTSARLRLRSSTLTMDASREVPDGLFVKVIVVIVVMDGSVGTIPEIQALAEERVRTALSSVNLEIP